MRSPAPSVKRFSRHLLRRSTRVAGLAPFQSCVRCTLRGHHVLAYVFFLPRSPYSLLAACILSYAALHACGAQIDENSLQITACSTTKSKSWSRIRSVLTVRRKTLKNESRRIMKRSSSTSRFDSVACRRTFETCRAIDMLRV